MKEQASPAPVAADHLIGGEDVDHMFGVEKTSRYRYIERGLIPKPIKLSKTIARWSFNECVEALERYKAAARTKASQ